MKFFVGFCLEDSLVVVESELEEFEVEYMDFEEF